jgi:hypothetical protein
VSLHCGAARIALACSTALVVGMAHAGPAQQPPDARARCRQDALGRWFCPSDPNGVAVTDNLGAVVCAAGSCVELEDEWHCSATSGGSAELTPEGPVCEGGCHTPRAAECDRI